jgi:hypothetical protein
VVPIESDQSTEKVTHHYGRRAEDRTAQLLHKAQVEGDVDFLKEGVRAAYRVIMEMKIESSIGQDPSKLLE